MLSRRPELIWLPLAALVLVLTIWWIPGASSVDTDSWSVAFGGKKVLYQSLRRLESDVSRSIDELIPQNSYADRILFLGPARYPSDEEWEQIHSAVMLGNSVVFAASRRDPYVDAKPFGVRVTSPLPMLTEDADEGEDEGDDADEGDGEGTDEAQDNADAAGNAENDDEDETADGPADDSAGLSKMFAPETIADTDLIEGNVHWRSSGDIEMDADDWDVLLSAESEPQIVRRRFGRGWFVLVASDDVFNNGSMVKPERALLAYRIIESAPTDGSTWFDETLNSSGVPKVLGILFDPLFRPVTLQLALIVILFGWLGSRRFGPIKQVTESRRRSIVEHAEAVGILYCRAGAGAHAVACQHEFLKQELRTLYGTTFRVDDAAAVARQAQSDENDVQQLFDNIRKSSQVEIDTASAGRLLRRLTQLISAIRSESRNVT